MPVYTRTGDKGETSLFGGKRVLKSSELVDAYGSIDELNSWVGLILSEPMPQTIKEFLAKIQSDLFVMGGSLAGWNADTKILEIRVPEMEVQIDVMEGKLPELTNFILPGGSKAGATVHLTRSVARRVERQIVALSQKQTVDGRIIQYLNRLSDLFFVLARFINKEAGVPEVTWSGISKPPIKKQK